MTPQEINTEKQKLLEAVNVAKTTAELNFLKENTYTVDIETYEMFAQPEPYIKPVNCPRGHTKCNDCVWYIAKRFSIKKVFCMRGEEYSPAPVKPREPVTDSLMNRKKYNPAAKAKKAKKEKEEL